MNHTRDSSELQRAWITAGDVETTSSGVEVVVAIPSSVVPSTESSDVVICGSGPVAVTATAGTSSNTEVC